MKSRLRHLPLGLLCLLHLGAAELATAQEARSTPALGRLFHSAERRVTLDRQRQFNIQEIRSLEGESLRLDGIVQRSGGKRTVWINGKPQSESEDLATNIDVRLNPKVPGQAAIAVGNDAPASLKVGESINRATGERDSLLGTGSVSARR